jgi:FtsZ-interacting cell division protein ZipA
MFAQARLIIVGLIILAVVIVGGGLWWNAKRTAALKARVVVAEQGAELAHETGAITERVTRTEITIRTQAERSVDVVQSAPGADTPLDPEFRDRLCAAVASLRDGAQACDDQPAAPPP